MCINVITFLHRCVLNLLLQRPDYSKKNPTGYIFTLIFIKEITFLHRYLGWRKYCEHSPAANTLLVENPTGYIFT